MENIEILVNAWTSAKKAEAEAVEWRRRTEDAMLKAFKIDDYLEGTENFDVGDYKVKVVGRLNRKIDSDKLQELAAENGLSEHLSGLFRWKPEINSTAWKAADQGITGPLMDAITTSQGRPSFSITAKEQ